MVKLISFPKNDYDKYLKAVNLYKHSNYKEALELLSELEIKKPFKRLTLKVMIDIYLNQQKYDKVYEIIENEFLESNLSEDYLIEKYIYTMLLEKKYNDASCLIELMESGNNVNFKLKETLNKLRRLSNELIYNQKIKDKYNLNEFKKHNDIIDLVLNIENFNYYENKAIISDILNDYTADPLIKYQIVKHLKDLGVSINISFTNTFNESYLIELDHFIDIYEDDIYLIPPKIVFDKITQYDKDFIINIELIRNIWLNEYLKIFPKRINDYNALAYSLHLKILEIFEENIDFDELKSIYNTDNNYVYKF